MKVTRISEVRGDETASYIVEDYKATTLGEFVVVGSCLKKGKTNYDLFVEFLSSPTVDFPDKTILEEPIYYIKGQGGWSRMDYEVYNCE